MDFIDKVGDFLSKSFHSLGALTDRMDMTSWAVVSILALVCGLLFMRGNGIKAA